jgi:hypothetical protein
LISIVQNPAISESSTDLSLSANNPTGEPLSASLITLGTEPTTIDPETFHDESAAAAATLAYGYSPALLEALYKKVLIGFGKNPFGRFSVAAIYDEATKEFRCEKKYMTVKYSVKRGRRSHAEYALNYASNSSLLHQPIVVPPSAITERTANSRKLSISLHQDGGIGSSLSTRNRSSSKPELHEGEEDPSLLSSATIPIPKRKRTSSSGFSRAKSGTGNSKYLRNDWNNGNYDLDYSNPNNLLTGFRNPDNDDPSLTFREAFQDCDTGEIYEGGWISHLGRHGKGICLYSDGLMYEGNWHRGKESGKGDLMTGDRRVIYTGDWLDGQMHGNGIYNYGNGDKYIGDFKECHRHGKGEYYLRNGCMYTGK